MRRSFNRKKTQGIPALALSVFFLVFLCSQHVTAKSNKQSDPMPLHIYGIEEYQQESKEHPDKRLVDLVKFIPGIDVDLRYAQPNNFTGRILYSNAKALLVEAAAEKLKAAQAELAQRGLGLKIWDAYRPYNVTLLMWKMKKAPPIFLAPPWLGSRHNRGIAIDVTLISLKTGSELKMPTDHDDFTERASHAYSNLPDDIVERRKLLRNVMSNHNFFGYEKEWWHYCLSGWEAYPILDVPMSFEP